MRTSINRINRPIFRTCFVNFCNPNQKKYRYPCTGRTNIEGFSAFVEKELSSSRRNIKEFIAALEKQFGWPRISLTNSGSSANLAASLTIAAKCRERKGLKESNEPTHLGEVLTAGFTFPSTMASLLASGFSLKVVDTEDDGFCLSPEAFKASITPNTVAVCVTHFLGFPAQMKKIYEIAKENNLFILQDACETMSLTDENKPLHEYGDISTWSFYHPHHLSSFGGGAVSSPHPDWQRLTESLTHWGRECTCHFNPTICKAPEGMHHNFYYSRYGHNLEMSELNACFARFQLQDWESMEKRRMRYYSILYDALKDSKLIRVYPMIPGCGSPFVFPIRLLNGQSVIEVMKILGEKGVEIRSLMGGSITKQPAYVHIPKDNLKNCQEISEQSFFVGVHQTLNENDVYDVASILKQQFHK